MTRHAEDGPTTGRLGEKSFQAARILTLLLAAAVTLFVSSVRADEAIDRLVKLVGRDAGLCVEIPRLDETVDVFSQGEFFRRLRRSQIYADWQAGNEYRRARGIVSVIEEFTRKSFRQFFRETFGTAVVVAVYAEPGPKMSAIMMTETASREALDAVVEGWNRAEPQHTETIGFAGRIYYKRTSVAKPANESMTLYYSKLGRTLLLSDHEEWVRRSLALAEHAGSHDSLLDLPAFQEARRSLQPGCAARAYVNPRAWDAVLGLSAGASPSPAHPGSILAQSIEGAWRRCRSLALGLQIDRGIVIEAVARYSTDGLTEDGRQLIKSMSGPADFLKLVPSDALVALAGRQAFGKLLRQALAADQNGLGPQSWESLRQVSRGLLLGMDPLDDVLPAFGENYGAWIVPRRTTRPDQLPVDGLVAVELPPAGAPERAVGGNGPRVREPSAPRAAVTFREALDNGLNTGFNFAAAYFNMSSTGKPAVVRTEANHGTRIRWIESLGPYEPAFGMTSRYLVLGTSPEAIRNFAASDVASSGAQAGPSAIDRLAKRYFPGENQLLFIDTAAICKFVHQHGEELMQHAVRCRSISLEQAKETLADFLEVAGLFDAVFAAGRLGDGTARLVMGGVVDGPRTGAQTIRTPQPSAGRP